MRCGSSAPLERRQKRALYLFGTLCSIELWGFGEKELSAALEAGVAEMERVGRLLNPFDSDSELSRVNRAAGCGALGVHPELFDALAQTQAMGRRTGGRFDPTVWPLLELWRRCEREERWPDEAERGSAVAAVDYRRVQLEPAGCRVRFSDPRTRVDLSSVAKGVALDAALRAVQHENVAGALLDAGGAVLAWHSEGLAYSVGVAHPNDRLRALGLLRLSNQAVATSGQTEMRLRVAGRLVGHLFDPRSGLSIDSDLASVSVVAPSARLADLLSTAAFVLGPSEGRRLLEGIPGTAALFVMRPFGKVDWAITERFRWIPETIEEGSPFSSLLIPVCDTPKKRE